MWPGCDVFTMLVLVYTWTHAIVCTAIYRRPCRYRRSRYPRMSRRQTEYKVEMSRRLTSILVTKSQTQIDLLFFSKCSDLLPTRHSRAFCLGGCSSSGCTSNYHEALHQLLWQRLRPGLRNTTSFGVSAVSILAEVRSYDNSFSLI